MEGRKRKKDFSASGKGWRTLDVGDDVLLGAVEGGFCGLEELDASENTVMGPNLLDEPAGRKDLKVKVSEKKSSKKEKQRGKSLKKEELLKTGSAGDASIAEMQARLAESEAQQKALKRELETALKKQKLSNDKSATTASQSVSPSKAPSGSEKKVIEQGEKPLNHAQRKKLARKEYKAAKREEFLKKRLDLRKAKKGAKQQPSKKSIPPKATSAPSSAKQELDPELHDQLSDEEDGDDEVQERTTDHAEAALPETIDSQPVERKVDVSAWDGLELDSHLLDAIAALGFEEPTPIQRECLPAAIRDRRDVIGAAQTGSGKTLAFGLPIVQALWTEHQQEAFEGTLNDDDEQDDDDDELFPPKQRRLRALILTPTRELALQICAHLVPLAKPCGVRVVPIVGGIAAAKQERLLRSQPEVVVATPGRLWELMRDGNRHLTDLGALSFITLDEADRMVQQGHFEELSSILEFVPKNANQRQQGGSKAGKNKDAELTGPEENSQGGKKTKNPRKMQTFVFSATLTMPESLRKRLRKGGGGASGSATLETLMDKLSFGLKPKIVDLTSQRRLADKVSEAYLECTEDDRDDRLYYLLTQHSGRTLVFANAISTVRRLAAVLRILNVPVVALHASMQQRQRLKALDRFREDESAVMVATDVAARGLDIPEVQCVVHYQIPAAVDVYVHRCGRTARAAAEGISVALVSPKETLRFRALRKAMGQDLPVLFPIDQRLLPGARKCVRLAVRLDQMMRKSSKTSADKGWEKLAAEEAGIELDNDEAPTSSDSIEIASLKKELAVLLEEPLQPKFSQRFFTGRPSAALLDETEAAKKLTSGPNASVDDPSEGENEGNELDKGPHSSILPATISKAVEHASRLASARSRGNESQKPAGNPLGTSGKKQSKQSKADILEAALQKQFQKKALKRAKKVDRNAGRLASSLPAGQSRSFAGSTALQALQMGKMAKAS